eukprot:8858-Rhodomonas_salina.1
MSAPQRKGGKKKKKKGGGARPPKMAALPPEKKQQHHGRKWLHLRRKGKGVVGRDLRRTPPRLASRAPRSPCGTATSVQPSPRLVPPLAPSVPRASYRQTFSQYRTAHTTRGASTTRLIPHVLPVPHVSYQLTLCQAHTSSRSTSTTAQHTLY